MWSRELTKAKVFLSLLAAPARISSDGDHSSLKLGVESFLARSISFA